MFHLNTMIFTRNNDDFLFYYSEYDVLPGCADTEAITESVTCRYWGAGM
ncbi:hypothetical protein D083_0269 [Dickeya solani RNS 08.23.3.1.A]|nr:hypothetical protein D083_0269 [Dickeya solani RNS 08.23.3.1.A]